MNFFGSFYYSTDVVTHFYVTGTTYEEVYNNICTELDSRFLDESEDNPLNEADYLQWLYFDHRELNSNIDLGYSIFIYKFVVGINSSHSEQIAPIKR